MESTVIGEAPIFKNIHNWIYGGFIGWVSKVVVAALPLFSHFMIGLFVVNDHDGYHRLPDGLSSLTSEFFIFAMILPALDMFESTSGTYRKAYFGDGEPDQSIDLKGTVQKIFQMSDIIILIIGAMGYGTQAAAISTNPWGPALVLVSASIVSTLLSSLLRSSQEYHMRDRYSK